jgi:hypothetical protein
MVVYVPAVFILTGIAFALLYIGHNKEDFPTLFFSGIVFILLGLTTFNDGFQDLTVTYTKWIGIIFMSFGAYVAMRTSLEYMQGNYDSLG